MRVCLVPFEEVEKINAACAAMLAAQPVIHELAPIAVAAEQDNTATGYEYAPDQNPYATA